MKNSIKITLTACTLAMGFTLFFGCSSDHPTAVDDPAGAGLGGPAEVLTEMRRVYEAMDPVAYERLIHSEFRFMTDLDELLDREEDLASTRRLFSGVAQKNSAGRDVPAIRSIEFLTLDLVEEWAVADDAHWSEAVLVRRAVVDYRFILHLDDGRILASGRQLVWAADLMDDGWKLLGQQDL